MRLSRLIPDAAPPTPPPSMCRQNAELAKLRQECTKLSKELGDKSDALLADEQQRKALEAKLVASEKQLVQVQVCTACLHHSALLWISPPQQSLQDIV